VIYVPTKDVQNNKMIILAKTFDKQNFLQKKRKMGEGQYSLKDP
jgi:hypothetical protein